MLFLLQLRKENCNSRNKTFFSNRKLIQDNAKMLEQLKSGFKITINWSKYQSKF